MRNFFQIGLLARISLGIVFYIGLGIAPEINCPLMNISLSPAKLESSVIESRTDDKKRKVLQIWGFLIPKKFIMQRPLTVTYSPPLPQIYVESWWMEVWLREWEHTGMPFEVWMLIQSVK